MPTSFSNSSCLIIACYRLNEDRESETSGHVKSDKIDVFGQSLIAGATTEEPDDDNDATTATVPAIVRYCVEKIENIGVTDGIYRISGKVMTFKHSV